MGHIPNGVYTAEFRSEAVKLVVQEGLSVDQAAKRLSVPKGSGCRRRWKWHGYAKSRQK